MSVLNDRELATMLAGLRLLQRATERGETGAVAEILADAGWVPSSDEIDALCERLNVAGAEDRRRVYAVIRAHGGLVQDVLAFSAEAVASAYIDSVIVREQPDRFIDTGIPFLDDGALEVRHTYHAADGGTWSATVADDPGEIETELYLEETFLLDAMPRSDREDGSARLRYVAW
jgi:hypothetical protein